jgi:glycerol-3-phosphate acyltransferase PlsY
MPPETWTWSLQWIPFFAAAFLVGSVPFGRLIGRRVAQVDIMQMGSRNIGATNVARELGMRWGLVTLALDMLKGMLPALIFSLVFPESHLGLSLVGLSALLGHQFSPFLGFRGGKGVATALGFFVAATPAAAFLAVIVFVMVVYIWDFISLGSILAAFSVPVFQAVLMKPGIMVAASLVVAAVICLKHKGNIQRIATGRERRWRGDRKGHGE